MELSSLHEATVWLTREIIVTATLIWQESHYDSILKDALMKVTMKIIITFDIAIFK